MLASCQLLVASSNPSLGQSIKCTNTNTTIRPKRGGPAAWDPVCKFMVPCLSCGGYHVEGGGEFHGLHCAHTLPLLGCQGEVCSIHVTVVMAQSNIFQRGMPLLGSVLGGKSHMVAPTPPFIQPKKKKKNTNTTIQ